MATTISRVFKPVGWGKAGHSNSNQPGHIEGPIATLPKEPLGAKEHKKQGGSTIPDRGILPKESTTYLNGYSDLPEVVVPTLPEVAPSILPQVLTGPEYSDLPQAIPNLPASLSSSLPEPVKPPGPPPGPREFPNSFNVYRARTGNGFSLGPHRRAPLYSGALHTAFSKLPDVVLHAGPAATRQNMWADVDFRRLGAPFVVVGLPPLDGHDDGSGRAEEHAIGAPLLWRFRVETGLGPGRGGAGAARPRPRREEFEWRFVTHARVGVDPVGPGWRLIRLAQEAPEGVARDTWLDGRERTQAPDGTEVVAHWVNISKGYTKVGKFEFIGSGAEGLLGERWRLMAVVTALGIWEAERRPGIKGAPSAGTGVGVGAGAALAGSSG